MLSTPFDDMDKDFDSIENMPEDSVGPTVSMEDAANAQHEKDERFGKNKPTRTVPQFEEVCEKCRGSGVYKYPSSYGVRCFACEGKGFQMFKKPKAEREKMRLQAAARKEKKEAANLAEFEKQYPQLAAWWTGSTFEFAVDLRSKVQKNGGLTVPQIQAAIKCADSFAAARAKRAEEQETAKKAVEALPVLDVSHITNAFDRAVAANIKRPKLRLFSGVDSFEFSRAPDTGKNPGAIYVNDKSGAYLGKVVSGRFLKIRDCNAEQEAEVLKVCSDPAQAAVAYGKEFGACSVCGRELSDPVSVERGIGPICEGRFFG